MTLKPKAKNFIFTDYKLEPDKKRAVFSYEIEFANRLPLRFAETIVFPNKFSIEKIPAELLENVLQSAHLILGISYYKLYCPEKIKIQSKPISKEQAEFWSVVYKKGLGEFFYKNKIDSKGLVNFPYDKKAKAEARALKRKERMLVGIGGGKDSIVAGELLKENNRDITALLIETQKNSPISDAVVEIMGVPSLKIKRYLDEKIFKEHAGAYNGHIPISAVFAFLGYLTAVLYDYSYVVVGNEYSSNFGNIKYKNEEINHQWSKSLEFENLFQNYAKNFLSPDITYFSLLRPFYEIKIAEMFAKYKKYFPVFSSCNRNFKVHEKRQKALWCGECAKCVFVFTMLSAFLKEKELTGIFDKNLYKDEKLLPVFANVLGFGKMKPFDCVGTFAEAQAALYLASENFKSTYIVKSFLKKIKNPKLLVEKVFKSNITPTIPEQFALAAVQNALILGYGKEGRATERYLKKYFPKIKITITDKSMNPDYLKMPKDFDVVIKTPGISGRKVSVPYITATNLFFSQVKNTVIGVTGSKGKSTTSSLIYSILKESGKKVTFLGNIGTPMLGALMRPIDKDEIFVLELSSYQLDDIKYSPQIAVMLNLFPEHMDYHGGVEKYYKAKSNIIKFQNKDDYFIYNGKDERLKALAKGAEAHTLTFAKDFDFKNVSGLLKGKHNEENMRAAITVARLFNVSEKNIKKAIEKFKPLPHRLESVGNFSGIQFIDDAISTTPESTIMALKTIPDIGTIFLGGEDRGYDFSELEKQLRKNKIKNIVLFPDTGKRILKSKKGFNVLETSSMEEAVIFAYKNTAKKSACLLSMASPSYSLWKNFEEKGDQFQYWVKKLSNKKLI